jgi:response regulator RpfG family c-di-GMP phosphodiesterase
MNMSVLLVDDEPNILSSLTRELLEEDLCDVITSQSGSEALGKIQTIPNLALIVSDYHMPGLNGIDFLSQARNIVPDVTRMILTGAGDLGMAVEAVNKGNIFRFMLKPCPTDIFISSVKEGIKQYRLVTSEKELLNKTLNGSIKVMIDILAASEPEIFAQSSRLRNLAKDMAKSLEIEEQSWELELAALLSRIGAVTVPHDIVYKYKMGLVLEKNELKMIESIPNISKQLIKNVPRLENIADAVGWQDCTFTERKSQDSPTGERIPLIARILKIIIDYDRYQDNSYSALTAYRAMIVHSSEYDPRLLDLFKTKVIHINDTIKESLFRPSIHEKEIFVTEVKPGMTIARNVYDKGGLLIVSRGTIITDVLRLRLINYFQSKEIVEEIMIESTI